MEVVSTEASEVSYPLVVDYCGVCGMPPEVGLGAGRQCAGLHTVTLVSMRQYCEYSPEPAKCYEWMKANLPLHYARVEQSGRRYRTEQIIDMFSACSVFFTSMFPAGGFSCE